MKREVKVIAQETISSKCHKCQGKCWDKNSQKNTQQNAVKMFGSIPNDCVNNANNTPRCPYALGLLK